MLVFERPAATRSCPLDDQDGKQSIETKETTAQPYYNEHDQMQCQKLSETEGESICCQAPPALHEMGVGNVYVPGYPTRSEALPRREAFLRHV